MSRMIALIGIAALLMGAPGCKKKAAPAPSKGDRMAADPGAMSKPGDGCDRAALSKEALAKGKKVMAGVTLAASTPQGKLLAAPDKWNGKKVRIEGPIVGICKKMGCWAALRGPSGKALNLKVVDGVIDFRKLAKKGLYAVGEGVFHKIGPHGAQVKITGAMISTSACN